MSDALLDKVNAMIEAVLANTNASVEQGNAILAHVETALVLARREGWNPGLQRFPLPTRTREVLREEPVPGRESAFHKLYRVVGGELQGTTGSDNAFLAHGVPATDFALMRHALDLHDRPTRTEEVPADERDPWGEGPPPPPPHAIVCPALGCCNTTTIVDGRAASGWKRRNGGTWFCPSHASFA